MRSKKVKATPGGVAGALAALEAFKQALSEPVPITRSWAVEIATRPVYLGRPRSASSFEQTPADILRRAEADGVDVSDELRAFVALDEAARATKLASRTRRPGGGRKPKAKKATQYDTWAEWRATLYHRLVRLPAAGKAASWLRNDQYTEVLRQVAQDQAVSNRSKAGEVLRRLARLGLRAPERRTVARHLAALRR